MPIPTLKMKNKIVYLIVYTFAIFDEDGEWDREPCVAWPTAEAARAAAASYLCDRTVTIGEADAIIDWQERPASRSGRYPTFVAPTKHDREVRVWPIEIIL